jgi:hypothetical protein
MMQCPNCQTGNRLGAIFCRSCGTKLELDEITAQTFEQVTGIVPKDKMDKKKRVRYIIVNVLRLVFLAAIVYGVYLAIQRPEVEQPDTSGRLASQFKTMLKEMLRAVDGKNTVTKTTSEQALNSYISSMLGATEMKGNYQLVESWVLIEDNGDVDWVVDAKLFGRLLRLQYQGTVAMKDGKVTFTPKGFFAARMGKLPYPTPLMKMMIKRLWRSILEQDERLNEKLLKAISELKFEGNKITVTVTP